MKTFTRILRTDSRLRSGGAWLLLVIGTSLLATVAHAGEGVWTSGGPDAYIGSLAVDPKTSSTLYAAGTDAVFKSTDSGGTWAITEIGDFDAGYGSHFSIDPSTPSTLYVATSGFWFGEGAALYKSTDAGAHWSVLKAEQFSALAVNPSNPTTLYAGTWGGGVFRSTDAGVSWSAVNAGLTNLRVTALAINPANSSTVFAGTTGGGVFKSTDSAASWTAISTGLPNLSVTALAVNPSNPSTLFAGTESAGVSRSIDGGQTWVPVNAGLTTLWVAALVINPANPSTIYAGTSGGGVFRSSDSGASWSALNAGLPGLDVTALALDSTGTTLYAGLYDSKGVWQLTAPTGGIAASFSFTPFSPSAGQTIQFTNMSTGSPTSWSWDFGDGFGSAAQNPTHAYATAGAFPVTLTASSSAGSNTTTKTVSVTSAAASSCFEDASTMCLAGGRYRVSSHWRNQYAGGAGSSLSTTRLTDATGAFWIANADAYEYLIRINTVTDNGRAWIAIATFTDVEFWIDVIDTVTGQSKEYHSPPGNKTLIYDPYSFIYP